MLFVSHSMNTVRQLTSRSVVLHQGQVAWYGPTEQAIDVYVSANRSVSSKQGVQGRRQGDGFGTIARITDVRFLSRDCFFAGDAPLSLSVKVSSLEHTGPVRLSLTLFRGDGTTVGSTFSRSLVPLQVGSETEAHVTLRDLRLAPGPYYFAMSTGTGDNFTGFRDFDSVTDVLHFEIARPELAGGGVAAWHAGWGAIRLPEPAIECVTVGVPAESTVIQRSRVSDE